MFSVRFYQRLDLFTKTIEKIIKFSIRSDFCFGRCYFLFTLSRRFAKSKTNPKYQFSNFANCKILDRPFIIKFILNDKCSKFLLNCLQNELIHSYIQLIFLPNKFFKKDKWQPCSLLTMVLWMFDEDELLPKDLLQTLMTNHREEYQKDSIDSNSFNGLQNGSN